MGKIRHGSATIEPARRHRFEPAGEGTPSEPQYSDPLPDRALLRNVPRGASFARAVEPGSGYQPQDGCEVAEADDGRGYEDWAVGTALNCFERGGGSCGRRVPAPHAFAAGRLPLRSAGFDPAPDRLGAASLSAREGTLPRCKPPRGSCIFSLVSTGRPSSRSPNSLKRLLKRLLGGFCGICSKPCPTGSAPFSPIEPLERH